MTLEKDAYNIGLLNQIGLSKGDGLISGARKASLFPAILKDGNTVAWYDYQENITKDESNLVSVWGDKSGLNHNLLQVDPNKSPTWTINGVLFDGIDDYLKTVAFTLVQPEQLYLLFKMVQWAASMRVFAPNLSSYGQLISGATSPGLIAYAGVALPTLDNLPVNQYGIARVLFNGVNSVFKLDDVSTPVGDAGPQNMGGFTLGAYSNGLANYNIEVKEVIIRKVADTLPNETAIYNYLKKKNNLRYFLPNRANVITDGKMSYLPTAFSNIITYGQSLSFGVGSDDILTTTPLSDTFMLDLDVRPRYVYPWPLTPLVANTYGPDAGECIAVSMANAFKTLVNSNFQEFSNNVNFLSVSAGASGTSIEQLSKENTASQQFYMERFYKFCLLGSKQETDAINKSISCPAIIYMQGEYNYQAYAGKGMDGISASTTDPAEYKRLLMILKNNMQNDIMAVYGQSFKPLFLIYQTSGVYVSNEEMTITMAQIEFAKENNDVILLNPHYHLPDFSGGHLTANGYRWDGELQAKSLYKIFVEGLNEYALKYNNITIESDIITIDLDVPVEPVVFDTYTTPLQTSYGFKVRQNGTELNITSVEIITGNQIKITMPSILSGSITIAYAGYGRNGSGNVRDSDPWVSQYNYANETLLDQPTYTPLDIDSNNLYGAKYPCQNWLQQFYYKKTI